MHSLSLATKLSRIFYCHSTDSRVLMNNLLDFLLNAKWPPAIQVAIVVDVSI